MDNSRIKKTGTREEVYNGLAARTAGGLKRDDIIEKMFGNRKLYISKKLSDKMKENFNIIRSTNPNHLKRVPKKTMVASQASIQNTPNTPIQTMQNQTIQNYSSQQNKKHLGGKTQKISFKIKENTQKTVYYPELHGMDLQELKAELAREEAEEDLGRPKQEFSIEDMPDIDISNLS
jgi:hypothetical protein